jgi:nucleotide-binding universal stress UspA family protein
MAFSMLVTLDGSAWSEGILEAAEQLARESHAKVYLLRLFAPVHDVGRLGIAPASGQISTAMYADVPPPATDVHEMEATTQAAARGDAEALAYLQPIVTRFAGLEAEPIVRESAHPARDIIATAERLGVNLIAMTTHGRTGLAHALLGSVAEEVVRSGGIPVLLVRPAQLARGPPLNRPTRPYARLRDIHELVPGVDSSGSAPLPNRPAAVTGTMP